MFTRIQKVQLQNGFNHIKYKRTSRRGTTRNDSTTAQQLSNIRTSYLFLFYHLFHPFRANYENISCTYSRIVIQNLERRRIFFSPTNHRHSTLFRTSIALKNAFTRNQIILTNSITLYHSHIIVYYYGCYNNLVFTL